MIGCLLLAAVVGGCESAPTPNPQIETTVEPMAGTPISGLASIADVGSGRLNIHIAVEPTGQAALAADVRRGGCESQELVRRLAAYNPANPFELEGVIDGSLASVRPVAVVLLDAATGRPIGCASFPMP